MLLLLWLLAQTELDVRVDEADVILAGKIVSREAGNSGTDVATLQVQEVLKGQAKEESIAFTLQSLALGCNKGEEGIWFFRRAGEALQWADYGREPLDKKNEIRAALTRQKERTWGKPVKGLKVFAQAMTPKVRVGEPIVITYGLQNESDQSLIVCVHAPQRPIVVEGGSGELYTFKGKPPALGSGDFMTISPGAVVRRLPPTGTGRVKLEGKSEPGTYEFTVVFRNKQEGKKFKLAGVWTGEAFSEKLVVVVEE
jgi:hypothetical protein